MNDINEYHGYSLLTLYSIDLPVDCSSFQRHSEAGLCAERYIIANHNQVLLSLSS